MACGIICQSCGIEAPTRHVEFHQNIGALVVRFHKSCKGNLCKRCIHRRFWQFTAANLTLGWWGYISLVMTPVFVINNTVRYLSALCLAPVPQGATVPALTPEALEKLTPHRGNIVTRLNQREPLESVSRDVAGKAGVTPGQVVKYVISLVTAGQQPPRAMGFGVQPLPSRGGIAGIPVPAIPLAPQLAENPPTA